MVPQVTLDQQGAAAAVPAKKTVARGLLEKSESRCQHSLSFHRRDGRGAALTSHQRAVKSPSRERLSRHAIATNMRGMSEVHQDEYGRPEIPLAADESETLIGFLDYQRATMAWKCRGLNDAQLRAELSPTAMTLGGMLKHLARVEDYWFSEVVAEGANPEPWADMPWAAEWQNASSHTGEELRQLWAERVEASRRVVAARFEAGEAALGATHPAWDGQGNPSLRWVLVHMIEEYARHNGHADLIRESIDGETGE